MKKILFPFLAAMALAGCSNDEPGIDNQDENDGNASYLAVSIVTPASNSPAAVASRGTDGGYSSGDNVSESKVENALFIIFDASGNQVGQQTPTLTFTANTTNNNPQVEYISNVVLVFDKDRPVNGSQILAVLNYPGNISTTANINTVCQTLESYMATTGYGAPDKFVMSNSVYKNGDLIVNAIPVGAHIYKSQPEAEADPVEIYVERVLAKVTTTAIANGKFTDDQISDNIANLDGVETTFIPEIKGIEVANVAEKSCLVKDITGINFTNWNWNDPANFRSYWATTPTVNYMNQSWNTIGETTASNAQTFYIHENTSATNSSVLITAQLTKADGTPMPTFVRYAGQLYTLDGYYKIIANELKSRYAIETTGEGNTKTYTSITPDMLTTHQDDAWKDWVAAAQLDATKITGKTFVNAATHTTVQASEINAFLDNEQYRAWQWTDGKCYYFVKIEHFGKDADNNDLHGIVRNHVYQLTLSSIKGLGVPVFNPDEIIIPDRPSDEAFYLAAKVNILKWKIVTQTINFE